VKINDRVNFVFIGLGNFVFAFLFQLSTQTSQSFGMDQARYHVDLHIAIITYNQENVFIMICSIAKIVHDYVDAWMPLVLALIRTNKEDPTNPMLKKEFEEADLQDPNKQQIIAQWVLNRILYVSYLDALDGLL
jgi:hypothetical protein